MSEAGEHALYKQRKGGDIDREGFQASQAALDPVYLSKKQLGFIVFAASDDIILIE